MSIKKNLFDYQGLGKEVHNRFLGKRNTELGEVLGISSVQAAKLRNGMEVGKETLFTVNSKLGISLDKYVIR